MFFLSLGATKVAPRLCPPCAAISFLSARRNYSPVSLVGFLWAGIARCRVPTTLGPRCGCPLDERRLASIPVSACLEPLAAWLGGQHECGPGRRTMR